MADRDFKGVWIPREIWLDERLTALDKVILTEIDSLDRGENGCFASNEHLAKFSQCGLTKVSTSISKLIDMGYVEVISFDGRKRFLHSRVSEIAEQPFKKCKADFQNLKDSNTYSNPKRNKNTSYSCAERSDEPSTPSEPPVFSLPLNDGTEHGITQTDFDTYKKLYPSVDVMQELRKMYGWLDSNPAKKKTRHGIKRFINGWLSREQDKGKNNGAVSEYIPPVYSVEETMRRAMDNSEPEGLKPIGGW